MKPIINHVIEGVSPLDHDELHSLEKAIEGMNDYEKVSRIIEENLEQDRICPHCLSHNAYRHGKSAGLQRYKCNECHKTFNALTQTPLARLRKKELWLHHLELMRKSKVLRDVAEELGIGLKTAFTWRHRFLAWQGKDTPEQLEGIIDADETYFRKSDNGDKML